MDALQLIARVLRAVNGPWAVGGDWECAPDNLRGTRWLKLVCGVIVAPKSPTCRGRVIDFFVVAECRSHATPVACIADDAGFHPHKPVRLLIKMKASAAMVRQLRVPIGFNAVLPHGPPTKPAQPSGDALVNTEVLMSQGKTTMA